MKIGRLRFESVVTVDEVHIKVQENQFYDFRLRYIEVREKTAFEEAMFVT